MRDRGEITKVVSPSTELDFEVGKHDFRVLTRIGTDKCGLIHASDSHSKYQTPAQ
jgi:hypothetical protein